MKDQIRIVVVGVGDFGARHAAVVAALGEAQLVGVVDADRARAEEVARGHSVASFQRLTEAVAQVRPDAVVIATPQSHHLEGVREAVELDLPVLVEKPVVGSVADADGLLELIQERPRAIVMPAHVSRFTAGFAAARQHLAGAKIQSLRAIRVVPQERLALHGAEHPALVAMVHDLDMVRALVPAELVDITSVQERTVVGARHPQIVMAHLHFADGTLASVENYWTMPHARTYVDARLEVTTKDEIVTVTLPGGAVRISTASGDFVPDTDLEGWVAGMPTGALATQMRHFVACVRDRQPSTLITVEEAVWSCRVAAQIVAQDPSRS